MSFRGKLRTSGDGGGTKKGGEEERGGVKSVAEEEEEEEADWREAIRRGCHRQLVLEK